MPDYMERLGRVLHRLDATRRTDRSFADALHANRKRLSAADRALAIQFIEGFDAADPADASERALAEGGSPSDEAQESRIGRLIDGYHPLMARLADPIRSRIKTGTIASAFGGDAATSASRAVISRAGHCPQLPPEPSSSQCRSAC